MNIGYDFFWFGKRFEDWKRDYFVMRALHKIELEELGKGLVIPADAFNLKESMRGPATGQFDAMAIEISSPRGEG